MVLNYRTLSIDIILFEASLVNNGYAVINENRGSSLQ